VAGYSSALWQVTADVLLVVAGLQGTQSFPTRGKLPRVWCSVGGIQVYHLRGSEQHRLQRFEKGD